MVLMWALWLSRLRSEETASYVHSAQINSNHNTGKFEDQNI